jgi:hypothetical protein
MASFIQAFSSHEIVTSPYLFFKANYPYNRIHFAAVCQQTWDEINLRGKTVTASGA